MERPAWAGKHRERPAGGDENRGGGDERRARAGGVDRQEVADRVGSVAFPAVPEPSAKERGEEPGPAGGTREDGDQVRVRMVPGVEQGTPSNEDAGGRNREQSQYGSAQR